MTRTAILGGENWDGQRWKGNAGTQPSRPPAPPADPCRMLPIPTALLALLLTLTAPAGDSPAGKIPVGTGGGISRIPAFTWTAAAWTAGDVITTQTSSHSVLHTQIVTDGKVAQRFDQTEDKGADKVLTVLEVDPRGPVRMRIDYRRMRFAQSGSSMTDGDSPAAAPETNPLAKHVFVLERNGETFRVLDASGKPVELSLAQLVLAEESARGGELHRAGDMFARELSGKPIQPGDTIEMSHDVARAFVDAREGLDAVSLKVVLMPEIGLDGSVVAAFETHLVVEDKGTDGASPTKIELSGIVRVDVATGRYLSTDLEGTLSLGQATADATRAVEVTGSGPWKIMDRTTYARAQ